MYKCININCVQKKAFSSIKITIYKLTKTSTVLSVLSLVFRWIVRGRAAPKLNIRQAKTRKQSNPLDRREHMYSYKRIFFNTKGRPSFLPVQRWEFIKENKKVRKRERVLFSFLFSFFLDRFLGRVLFFFFLFSYFLVFFYKFPPLSRFQ